MLLGWHEVEMCPGDCESVECATGDDARVDVVFVQVDAVMVSWSELARTKAVLSLVNLIVSAKPPGSSSERG